ncbi:alpha/beta fold hydrolase [Chitinophaga ginsengisoli]|uniref:Pimeloyl-ACP methyl ester carboxylesterase n=1 Tax=Chitinophaga ginsengisoli TaxID=363837 RepID=A0A2P8FPY8_9BACT|nr:alpha/beta hydrolase [Chitinophaga ginsengisoli]PSL23769.1 pimeloyl-ACP methyl ester carboxylesterase [Chitinophaga ginsengisoli]
MQAQMPDAKFIQIESTKLCYYEQGQGDVILLLHGWPQTSYVWRKVMPALAKKNRVIAVDLPGLGNSGAAESYDTRTVAAIISKFITTLKIGKVHLVSHDVGSWVAVSFALDHEAQLNTLTVIDAAIPGFIADGVFKPENAKKIWQFYFHAVADIPEWLVEGREEAYLSWYFSNKSFVKAAINEDDRNVYVKAYTGKERLGRGFAYYRAFSLSAENNRKAQRRLSVPVWAIGGQYALGEQIGNALKAIADPTVVVIKDCGHYVPEEQPEETVKYISAAIGG